MQHKFVPQGALTTVTHTVVLSEARASEVLGKGDVEEALKLCVEHGVSQFSTPALQMRMMLAMRKARWDESNVISKQLLQIRPDALAWKMAGDNAYLQVRYAESEECYRKALMANPNSPEIEHDLGVAIVSQGRVDEAIQHFRNASALVPERADFHHHLAIMLVLGGHEAEGWREMEWRMQCQGVTGTYPQPEKYWKGENLDGKTIVVRSEQGWGDTIMFARYLPALAGAKRVYFYCQRAMLRWVERYYPDVVAWPNDCPPPLDFDYHINLMSFPNVFPGKYFPAKAQRSRGEGIGVCWFGSPTHKADHLRTVPIERFGPLAEVYGRNLYCLGYGRFENKPAFIDYLIDRCHDWADTADIVKNLDLVITVDTAIAHLAGFLGVETWLLLPYVPDFRWGMSGERTPWYDSVKIYRQPKLFDWDSVFARVREDLAARVAATSSSRAAAPFFAHEVSDR